MPLSLFVRSFAKVLLVSFILFLFPFTFLQAQTFTLGVKVGPSISWTAYGDKDYGKTIDSKPKFGFNINGILSFPLKNNYACVIEGGFSQRGRNVEFDNGSNQNKATYQFLDGSLLLRKKVALNLGKNIPGKIFFNVGPHVSYWLGGSGHVGTTQNEGTAYTVKFSNKYEPGDFNTMFMVDANRWLFGADIGVGIEAPLKGTQKILVELRYMWGHTYFGGKTTQNYDWVSFNDNNLQANEQLIGISAAYTFDVDLKENKKGRSTKDRETHRKPVKKRRR